MYTEDTEVTEKTRCVLFSTTFGCLSALSSSFSVPLRVVRGDSRTTIASHLFRDLKLTAQRPEHLHWHFFPLDQRGDVVRRVVWSSSGHRKCC